MRRILLLFALVPHAYPQPRPMQITIAEAVEEAIQSNPGLNAVRLGLPVADAAQITAKLRPNPVVSYSSDHLDWLGTGYDEKNSAGPPEIALRVDMPFERGGKRQARLDTAAFDRRIAEAQIADAIRKLKQDVTLACIDLLDARARLALADDNLRSLERIVQLNDVRVKAGSIAPVELTRSRVAMLQFRTAKRAAELAVTTAQTKLKVLLGRPAAAGEINVAAELKPAMPPRAVELETLREAALASRPDLSALQLTQARSQSELRLQIAQGKVDYTFGMEYRRQQGVNGKGNSLGFFASAPLPVFSRNQGEIARVRAEQAQITRKLQALEHEITGEVTAAYQEYETARMLLVEIERDLLGPSTEARDTTAYVYQAGASSLMEVLDAQRAFNETMSAYTGAQADYRRAAGRLESAVGKEMIP